MKLTQPKKVMDITCAPIAGMASAPSVDRSDSIMHAVELMLKHDLKAIAVLGNGRLIGHLRLVDALQHLGLQMIKENPPGRAGNR
jgi:CBS-domain-containing membrane protein